MRVFKIVNHCRLTNSMAYGIRRFNAAFTRALQLIPSEVLCDVSEHPCFYSVRLLASRQTPQAGGPLLVGCPRLLIQYIRS